MKHDFKLTGLSRPFSMTCETRREDIFWPKVGIPQDRFDALFNWAKSTEGFWKDGWIAEIEHDAWFADGTPVNPVVVAIREGSLLNPAK